MRCKTACHDLRLISAAMAFGKASNPAVHVLLRVASRAGHWKRICIASSSLCSQHNRHCWYLKLHCRPCGWVPLAATLRILLVLMGLRAAICHQTFTLMFLTILWYSSSSGYNNCVAFQQHISYPHIVHFSCVLIYFELPSFLIIHDMNKSLRPYLHMLNVSPIGDNFTGPNISHDTKIATTMRL